MAKWVIEALLRGQPLPPERKHQPYTGDWFADGMVRCPPSQREADRAKLAKAALEKLTIFSDVRAMICAGGVLTRIAQYILERTNLGLARRTILEQVILYKRYWIFPDEIIKRPKLKRYIDPNTGAQHPLVQQVMAKRKGCREVEIMWLEIERQQERIHRAEEMELKLQGMLMPGLKEERRLLKDMLRTVQEMQSDIGLEGYQRASKSVDVTLHKGLPQVDWSAMPEKDRAKVAEFAGTMMSILDGSIPITASDITPLEEDTLPFLVEG